MLNVILLLFSLIFSRHMYFFFFFFNDTATTEIYTLSLHDALPISCCCSYSRALACRVSATAATRRQISSAGCNLYHDAGVAGALVLPVRDAGQPDWLTRAEFQGPCDLPHPVLHRKSFIPLRAFAIALV